MKNVWIIILLLLGCKAKPTSEGDVIKSISIDETNKSIYGQNLFIQSEDIEFPVLLQDYCIGTHNFVLFQNKLYIYIYTWNEMSLINGNVFEYKPIDLNNSPQLVCDTAININIEPHFFQEVYKKDIQQLLDSVLSNNPKEKPLLFSFAIDTPETQNDLLLYTINTIYKKSPAFIWKVRSIIPLEEKKLRSIE